MRIVLILFMLMLLVPLSGAAKDKFHNLHSHVSIKVNYDSLFTSAVTLVQSEAGQKLKTACIEAYGGKEHLEKLTSFQLEHDMLAYMRNDTIKVDRYFSKDHRYKILRHQEPTMEGRILNNNDSWFMGRDTTIILYSGKHKAELFSYLTLSMPLGIETERFDDIRFSGPRSDEDPLQYIYMKKNDSLMIILGIDRTDNFIKLVEGVIYQDENSFVFKNEFSGYRAHDGYYFPDSLINYSMGLKVAVSSLKKVLINPKFTGEEFKPQDGLSNAH